ncbi:hypothetical protein [Neochlamydia sp. S13]|uniref:hypothetical protein n=2 Tax=unclassified Neochlamydia TaxID=2643326 RepID=UPI0005A7447A|nr:hypothetical protein [Neochlamydia sp. S13]BBI17328.1 hypothetical protein NCS13_1_1133 [Neochlamydia sp. S13]
MNDFRIPSFDPKAALLPQGKASFEQKKDPTVHIPSHRQAAMKGKESNFIKQMNNRAIKIINFVKSTFTRAEGQGGIKNSSVIKGGSRNIEKLARPWISGQVEMEEGSISFLIGLRAKSEVSQGLPEKIPPLPPADDKRTIGPQNRKEEANISLPSEINVAKEPTVEELSSIPSSSSPNEGVLAGKIPSAPPPPLLKEAPLQTSMAIPVAPPPPPFLKTTDTTQLVAYKKLASPEVSKETVQRPDHNIAEQLMKRRLAMHDPDEEEERVEEDMESLKDSSQPINLEDSQLPSTVKKEKNYPHEATQVKKGIGSQGQPLDRSALMQQIIEGKKLTSIKPNEKLTKPQPSSPLMEALFKKVEQTKSSSPHSSSSENMAEQEDEEWNV